jgi:hypothetical protein
MNDPILKGALEIQKLCSNSEPFFVGRNGTIETEVIYFWKSYRPARTYPDRMRELIQRNAGIFPSTDESIDRWCAEYVQILSLINGGAAGWYAPTVQIEKIILDYHAPNAFRTPLRSLEPYYVAKGNRWTEKLAGKKVAVVSSFAATIEKQLSKSAKIWPNGLLDISGVKWSFVRTGYAPVTAMGNATWPSGCNTWEAAVEYVVKEVGKPDIALIGCGGLGMIIAGRLKAKGVSAIVLGGAIQVLFGIKGKRWETHDIISKFWNDAWVFPSATEFPAAAYSVEGGCYW